MVTSQVYVWGMPYTWSTSSPENTARQARPFRARAHAPSLQLKLTTHNSLSPKGFVWFIGITAILMAVPLGALLGMASLWMILGFLGISLASTWVALRANWKRGETREDLLFWSDHLILQRHNPDQSIQEWTANPYWVQVLKYENDGPVPHYVTLQSTDREVELGSFLAEEEREELYRELIPVLSALRGAQV